jgi:hypothetical protein
MLVAATASASTVGLAMLLWWGRGGGHVHDVLVQIGHLVLQLLVLDGHVGELAIKVAVCGCQLLKCGTVGGRGGCKVLCR